MKLLKQNDEVFNEYTNIQNFGCRFRCLQAIAEFESGISLTHTEIKKMYDTLTTSSMYKRVMGTNCACGKDEHIIIDMTFDILKVAKKGRQIGSIQCRVPRNWAGDVCSFDYVIQHWETQTSDGHFILADNTGLSLLDPWNYELGRLSKKGIDREYIYGIKVK